MTKASKESHKRLLESLLEKTKHHPNIFVEYCAMELEKKDSEIRFLKQHNGHLQRELDTWKRHVNVFRNHIIEMGDTAKRITGNEGNNEN